MKLPRSAAASLGIAAAALAGLTGVAVASGVAPTPSFFQLASSSDDAPGDISGPCDEAEHAGDPRCAGTAATTGSTAATPTTPTTPTTAGFAAPGDDAVPPATDGTHTLAAADAGIVTYQVSAGTLTLVSATPNAGWRVEIEQGTGREIEVDFRSGSRRVQVNVEFEDGQARERVRVRDAADGSETRIENGQIVRQDDGVDNDNSGPGSGDDDSVEDNSGPGSGDDSGDEDNSGPGSGDDDSDDDSGDDSGSGGHGRDD